MYLPLGKWIYLCDSWAGSKSAICWASSTFRCALRTISLTLGCAWFNPWELWRSVKLKALTTTWGENTIFGWESGSISVCFLCGNTAGWSAPRWRNPSWSSCGVRMGRGRELAEFFGRDSFFNTVFGGNLWTPKQSKKGDCKQKRERESKGTREEQSNGKGERKRT